MNFAIYSLIFAKSVIKIVRGDGLEECWSASISQKWIWWSHCGRTLSCGWRLRYPWNPLQTLTIPHVAFTEWSGMDEKYDYLKEILLWDPLSETWQVLCQSRLATILYISSNQIWNWQNVCHFATIFWPLNIIPNQRPMWKTANLQHIALNKEASRWGKGKSEKCSREWF